MYVIVATPVRFFQTKSGVAALTSPLLHEASLSCPAPVRMNALLSCLAVRDWRRQQDSADRSRTPRRICR